MNIDREFIRNNNHIVGAIADIMDKHKIDAEVGEAIMLYMVGMSVAVRKGDALKLDLQPFAYGHNVAQLGLASGEL